MFIYYLRCVLGFIMWRAPLNNKENERDFANEKASKLRTRFIARFIRFAFDISQGPSSTCDLCSRCS